MGRLSRRQFLRSVSAASAIDVGYSRPAGAASGADAAPAFFNAPEARFIQAAVERLIPSDEVGPGAREADVARYIDLQLAGAWGAGERLYRSGPWKEGTPSQGYQLPFTPAELFRTALRAVDTLVRERHRSPFHELAPEVQDQVLTDLQKGQNVDLDGVPSHVFFESLLAMTIEGYFSDPVYGGNRDMATWRMIGFPGAYGAYYHLVDQHGLQFDREPVSLSENARREIHLDPSIPAHVGHHDMKM